MGEHCREVVSTTGATDLMLTDSHCHLTSRQFVDDTSAVIARAEDAGVRRMVTIGCDLKDSPRCIELAARHEAVHAAVGIHPCSVTEVTDDYWLEKIRSLAGQPGVVAIGEIGLDYFHAAPEGWTEEDYHSRQAEFFTAQLGLAAELGLNIVVHQRDKGVRCWRDIIELVTPFHGKLRAVFHCFTHSWSEAKPLVEHGHLISFTGITTFKSAKEMQQCATDAEVGSFMVETDAPYLAPAPHRGKRCEPAYTRHTAEFIAKLRGISVAQLAAETERTADSFYRFANDGRSPVTA